MTDPAEGNPAPATDSPAGLDLDRLRGFLAAHRPELAAGPLRAELVAGGRSNLTYLLQAGGQELVLRRPPLGHVLATAHDMAREFRVISALAPTDVPVPQALLLCADTDVLGAPFYLMERVTGEVFRDRSRTDRLTGDQRRALAMAMMDTLAALHVVEPASVGLADFGRPEGYLARQVRRWAAQLDRSRSRPLPGIDELRDQLAATAPEGANAGRIVHGDYRLDNLLATVDPVTVTAVLDWEMATLGDPLADLGLLLTYWTVLGGGDIADGNPVADALGPRAGFPDGSELIDRYAGRSDVDVGPLHWHVALGCFKLAVICEGIHYRHTLGQTLGEGFDTIGHLVAPLVATGLTSVKDA
ncbi:Predicted kinase, aminoglycoside phosphotransferase (APT) family [Micromonospora phaseoli]|uniref:Predicted kinase, aminoglycoside phosphotransferase (APT) family n=1 Tax=Micromonospora phaseoli TaxID=1144548 RepID=A0A1H6RWS2_9ACTN|nr:phosphotransferase family protein [Micromonospora phaseoli]PZW03700.1 aminoglycoside phosphotransferase (APT) family kinase protein [Micromonospora phaseoli]GIJ80315.1 acyl-CoA dehydrogenase [Micromonospora phaseoli]SEI60213.1 Predicted kinase, aminoglycoside phosphotransferase (APT) family [Micromonospora phaseoli]